MNTRMKGLNK